MRVAVLGAVLGFLLVLLPWRLATLGVRTLTSRPHIEVHLLGTNVWYWQVMELEAHLVERGWRVAYEKLPPRFYGKTCLGPEPFGPCLRADADRLIVVNNTLAWDDRYETLAHEAGHTFQPYGLEFSKGQQEMFAEAVAALVTGRYREPAHYLAVYRADVLTLLVYQSDIYHAVGELTR